MELHVFADASIQAIAAVAYLHLEGDVGAKMTLIMAKTRVAPVKDLTVLRLELQSAVIATRLALFIAAEHSLQFTRKIFWS